MIRNYRRPDGTRHTYESIVKASNGKLTSGYLTRLRKGRAKPGYDVIESLSRVFEVSPSYFFDAELSNGDSPEPQLPEDVIQIAFRVNELDGEAKQAITSMLNYLRGKK